MRLSLFRVFVVVSLSPDDADSAPPWQQSLLPLAFCSASVSCSDDPTLDFGYVLFVSRAVYESVSTIFSRSNPQPPLCRETSPTSTSTRFAFSRQGNPPSILQRLRGGPCDSPWLQRRRLTGERRRTPGRRQYDDPKSALVARRI